jgi:hypothetical protein
VRETCQIKVVTNVWAEMTDRRSVGQAGIQSAGLGEQAETKIMSVILTCLNEDRADIAELMLNNRLFQAKF